MNESSPVDRDALWQQVGEDAALLAEVVELFLGELPSSRAAVHAAVANGDAHAVDRAAHRLKGALVNLGARLAAEAALALETLGRSGALAGAPELRDRLDAELDRAAAALTAIRAEALAPR